MAKKWKSEKVYDCYVCTKPITAIDVAKGNVVYIGQGLYRHKKCASKIINRYMKQKGKL